jgi:DNA-binding response OmpR family regulator
MATILIANADHKFTEVLRGVLAAYRHEVVTARTGEEALLLFESNLPAVVLLDLGILGMSGLEVLAKMRARAPHIPVVILSGEVPIEVEDRARELGVADVLRKRLKMDIIMQVVSHALRHAEPPAPAVPSVPAPVRPAAILVVDDDREICDLLSEFLDRRGYRVKTAFTGEAALGMIQEEPPDLILLDIYMPGMNGVEVLRRLMAPGFPIQPLPSVIMLTASQDVPLLKESLDLGAFDVLTKPADLKQVELAVTVKLAMTGPE